MESRGTEEGLLCDRTHPGAERNFHCWLPSRVSVAPRGGGGCQTGPCYLGDKERGLVHQKGWAWVGSWLTVSGPLWPTRTIT